MPDLNPNNPLDGLIIDAKTTEQWKSFSHRLQAEHRPITPEDQRCVERMQNQTIRKLRNQLALQAEELRFIRSRLDALEASQLPRLDWTIKVPPPSFRLTDGMRSEHLKWDANTGQYVKDNDHEL